MYVKQCLVPSVDHTHTAHAIRRRPEASDQHGQREGQTPCGAGLWLWPQPQALQAAGGAWCVVLLPPATTTRPKRRKP
jgi:hypothetical protein